MESGDVTGVEGGTPGDGAAADDNISWSQIWKQIANSLSQLQMAASDGTFGEKICELKVISSHHFIGEYDKSEALELVTEMFWTCVWK